jgi:hypothetical protein
MIAKLKEELRDELLAAVHARQELGAQHEEHLVDAFLQRLDREMDVRIEARMRAHRPRPRPAVIAVAIVALIFAIPLSAIAGYTAHFAGLLLVWTGIAAVVYLVGRE